MSSSFSPQAGHLALSTLRIRLRYPLSGICLNLSCAMLLASSLGSLGLLMAFRNMLDGAVSSILANTLPRSDSLHGGDSGVVTIHIHVYRT